MVSSYILHSLSIAFLGNINGSLIHSQKRRLERWAEHFEEQFCWPPATQPVEIMRMGEWNASLDRPSEEEIGYEIALLKREKAPGPDGLYRCYKATPRIP
ncbi:hypothetical protein T265_04084 [Opisthorchis viverrini]|uniref:Uncharacterized protein n=1 Tax=Opisthorchis viverrini TaxID=6198 RepID=A0A074ZTV6_OPIVI|nr:hypothetical protein T265_04084 [Opisthorchis viverrini]KER29237.1 hypothetical protein T265_04084 [Opisthorchis viverrini]